MTKSEKILVLVGSCVFAALSGSAALATLTKGSDQQPPAVHDEIRTRSLIIEDEAGRTRALLSQTEDGPVLALTDSEGTVRFRATVRKMDNAQPEPVGVDIFSAEGEKTLGILTTSETTVLSIDDSNGDTRIRLAAINEGSASISASGRPRLYLEHGDQKHFGASSVGLSMRNGEDLCVIRPPCQLRASENEANSTQ